MTDFSFRFNGAISLVEREKKTFPVLFYERRSKFEQLDTQTWYVTARQPHTRRGYVEDLQAIQAHSKLISHPFKYTKQDSMFDTIQLCLRTHRIVFSELDCVKM